MQASTYICITVLFFVKSYTRMNAMYGGHFAALDSSIGRASYTIQKFFAFRFLHATRKGVFYFPTLFAVQYMSIR